MPAGVFPELSVIQARRRSSDGFFDSLEGSRADPAGATAVKPDPMDCG